MRLNAKLDAVQALNFETLLQKIKFLKELEGTEEERKSALEDIAFILVSVKHDLLQASFYKLVYGNLSPDHEFTFFDMDDNMFKRSKVSEIEVVLGDTKPLTEEEINLAANALRPVSMGDSIKPKRFIELNKYDNMLAQEAEQMAALAEAEGIPILKPKKAKKPKTRQPGGMF